MTTFKVKATIFIDASNQLNAETKIHNRLNTFCAIESIEEEYLVSTE